MNGASLIIVGVDESDQRLDRWVRRKHPGIPQAYVEKLCRRGEIRVDGGRVKPATRLLSGQTVRLPPINVSEPPRNLREPIGSRVSEADSRMILDCVIFRDDDVIALNKPPGLAVQGGSGQFRHVDGLAEALRFGASEKPRLVHRLDKDTSGVLLLARNARSAARLALAFQSRRARKVYWATVAGRPSPIAGTIRYGLLKSRGHGDHADMEKMEIIQPSEVSTTSGAKRATTDYFVIESAANRAAWVALSPITGRTHQLRAHMAAIGHPIIGDGKYGKDSQENAGSGWGAKLGGAVSQKLHLHAAALSISHPTTGATVKFRAPLPEHMERTWDLFGWRASAAFAEVFDVFE